MTINNRGLSGQPTLPYVDYRSYAGVDVFMDLTFLDHSGVPVVPISFQYQVDDMTNATNIIPATQVIIGNTTYVLQLPGSQLNMTHEWQGSEIFQLSMQSTWTDTVTGTTCTARGVAVLELLAIQTPFQS